MVFYLCVMCKFRLFVMFYVSPVLFFVSLDTISVSFQIFLVFELHWILLMPVLKLLSTL